MRYRRAWFRAAPVVVLLGLAGGLAWARPGEVTLAAVGDILLARGPAKEASRHGWDHLYAKTARTLRAADIAVGNLECVLGEEGVPVPKRFSFTAPEAAAVALKRTGFDLLFLANNHTWDRGRLGLAHTMELLGRQGLSWAGAGDSLAAAETATVLERNGLKVAFLSFSDWMPEGYLTVPDRPSIALTEPEEISSSVREARRQADVVIVSFHWGVERSRSPSPRQHRLARLAIDSGADAVLGHHPHVRQPVEWYRGRPVFYSLGNFIFDLRNGSFSNGWLTVLRLRKHRVSLDRMGQVEIHECQPRVKWMRPRTTRSAASPTKVGRAGHRSPAPIGVV
jgi:poly-gamma-glutamate synthesis protein (capsule biosynthesis protein)